MNTRARVAAWLANYECGGCTAATFEDAADDLIAVVFADGGE